MQEVSKSPFFYFNRDTEKKVIVVKEKNSNDKDLINF